MKMETKTKPSILKALAEIFNNSVIGYEELTDPEFKKVIEGIEEKSKEVSKPINNEESSKETYIKNLNKMTGILKGINNQTIQVKKPAKKKIEEKQKGE